MGNNQILNFVLTLSDIVEEAELPLFCPLGGGGPLPPGGGPLPPGGGLLPPCGGLLPPLGGGPLC